jgi:hypothetical protein
VQFVGGAFILAGVTLVRTDELRASPAAAGPSGSRAGVPELADSGVRSRGSRPSSLI